MSFGLRRFILYVFSFVKLTYYACLNIFIKEQPRQINRKSLLIIKLDEIGDYILFRNLLKYFKASDRYNNYKITLAGNVLWKCIFNYFDKDYVDALIWVNKKKFSRNLFYRKKILKYFANEFYDTVINCSISRNLFADDSIVRVVGAKFKLGSSSDLSNQFLWQKKISDNYYSELFEIDNRYVFEFQRNKNFIFKILNAGIRESVPFLEKNKIKFSDHLTENYAAIYLGGKVSYKVWHTDNFITVARHLNKKYNIKIVILGATEDIRFSKEFVRHFDNEILTDYTAKTNLIDVMEIINSARIMITNDSGLAHIAAALATPVIVLANGTHFGRFFPYPEEAPKVKAIYPPLIEDNLQNFNELVKKYRYRSKLDINHISPETVISVIDNYDL